MTKIILTISNKTSYKLPTKKLIEEFVLSVLNDKKIDGEIELGLTLIGKDEMQALNKEYRGKDYPTDVLSFPIFDQVSNTNVLPINIGDLFISPDVMKENCLTFKVTPEVEFENLVKHGTLHLLGFHHAGDE